MARLYPPVTEEVLSAFCLDYNDKGEKVGASININFNLNRAVANAEITGIALRLRTISTNKYVITENLEENKFTGKSEGIALTYDLSEGKCTFAITYDNNPEAIDALKVGQYYRAQLAFIDTIGNIGYWSTVATIKCVARPSVTIANYNPNDANVFSNEILGEYVQDTSTGDSSEKVYSYRFQLYDSENNLLDDTGVQLHNSSFDVSSNSSTDEYYCYEELAHNASYYLIYSITTINGLSVTSPRYQIIAADSIEPEENITLIVSNGSEEYYYNRGIPTGGFPEWTPWEEGLVKIYPDLEEAIKDPENYSDKAITGNFVILRSCSKDNFHTWQEVRRFRLVGETPRSRVFYDYTVEQGLTYRYAIQQYNRQHFYSKRVYSYKRNPVNGEILFDNGQPIFNDIVADFEDMFLYDGKRQLKIRFNPQVTSFKNDLQEQKIDTIGSKHPFIFRNGNICYKEFPISGLISFQQDGAKFFINDEDYAQMNLSRFEPDKKSRDKDSYTYYKQIGVAENGVRNDNDEALAELMNAVNNSITLFKKVTLSNSLSNLTGHENFQATNDFLSEREKNLLLKDNSQTIKEYTKYIPIDTYEEAINLFNEKTPIYRKLENVIDNAALGTRQNISYIEPNLYNKTDLTSENIMTERYFKLLVLDWLTDGKPKLFRSPTEGNYIVRLLNVNLTPKAELGRMIHEFTCTAYEIADFNYQNLLDLGLLNIESFNEIEKHWFSKEAKNIFVSANKNSDGYYSLDLENKEIIGVQFTGFEPGDRIQITTKDSATPMEVIIGTTGTYIYDKGISIMGISILPLHLEGNFSRSVLLASQGYGYQRFDTMASISTYTQIGEQLVGPISDFLKKTVVGVGNYSASPNVDLFETEGTKLRVSEILHLHAKRREIIPIFYNENTSQSGASTIIASKNITPTFSLTPFGQGYIRGKSIMPTKRIDINTNNEEIEVPLVTWATGNLSNEELEKSRSIKELVDFVISKCNKDIFCLFEVYIPNKSDEGPATDWVPYQKADFHGTGDLLANNISGIYDPYLYNWQNLRIPESVKNDYEYMMGWWPLTPSGGVKSLREYGIILPQDDFGEYDPTLIFYYGNEEVKISLAETGEISLDNIRVPDYISIGNGVIMEPIYRLQYIDYTIENENSKLKLLRNEYLNKKLEAQEHILKYRAGLNAHYMGEILSKQYNAKLAEIQDYENYKIIIETLTNKARDQQLLQLNDYFNKEKSLVDIILSQVKILDLDLAEQFSTSYEDGVIESLYPEDGQLSNAKQQYDNFFNNSNNFEEDGSVIIRTIDKIGNSANEKGNILTLITHIVNSGDYNFSNILNNLIENSLNPKITVVSDLLNDLGANIYVGQYLQLLNNKAKELFFSKIKLDNIKLDGLKLENGFNDLILDNFKNDLINLYIINKPDSFLNDNNPKDNLNNTIITNSLWDEYLYLDRENPLLELSLVSPTQENEKKYSISNFEKYYVKNQEGEDNYYYAKECLLNYLKGIDKKNKETPEYSLDNTNNNILKIIDNLLNRLNDIAENGQGRQERENTYNTTYYPVKYSDGKPNSNQQNEIYWLGVINDNYTITKEKYLLETIIDEIYLSNPSITIQEVLENISNRNIFTSLPSKLQEKLMNKEEGSDKYNSGYIYKYLKETDNGRSPRSIYQDIYAAIAYQNEHSDELSDQQKEIIKSFIDELKGNEESPTSYYNFIIDNPINNYFVEWEKAYDHVGGGEDFTYIQDLLQKNIDFFNKIIRYENSLINEFNTYRNRYEDMLNNYSMSDNIKEVLGEEKQSYEDVKERILEIKQFFDHQLKYYQKDVLFDGYFEFLESYLTYKNTNTSMDKNAYLQLLENAQAMAQTTINEQDSPYNQQLIIQQYWKRYLDALKEIYEIEIKERFD